MNTESTNQPRWNTLAPRYHTARYTCPVLTEIREQRERDLEWDHPDRNHVGWAKQHLQTASDVADPSARREWLVKSAAEIVAGIERIDSLTGDRSFRPPGWRGERGSLGLPKVLSLVVWKRLGSGEDQKH